MFGRWRKKADSSPPKALVIFAWVWILLAFLFASGVLVTNHRQQEGAALGENSHPPSPRIFSVVVPSSASSGNEVIIRGGKFGSRGQVCFRFSQENGGCPHPFEVLVWSSSSIRAQIPEIENGEGTLWMVMGEGRKSNEVDFTIE